MKFSILSALLALSMTGPAMADERIRISSDWGEMTAELADNAATKALVGMSPVTLDMRDHMRQEKSRQLAIAPAGDHPPNRVLQRHPRPLEFRPLRYLLSGRPGAAARDHHPWAGIGRRIPF